jgi:hypothetical protein
LSRDARIVSLAQFTAVPSRELRRSGYDRGSRRFM